jgi:hypothetical protein
VYLYLKWKKSTCISLVVEIAVNAIGLVTSGWRLAAAAKKNSSGVRGDAKRNREEKDFCSPYCTRGTRTVRAM